MKKTLLLLTLATTFSLAAFEPKVEGYITNKLQLNETTSKTWEFGKSALKISSKSGDTAFYSEVALDKLINNGAVNTIIDYLWLDTPSPLGTVRIGTQKLSPKSIESGLAHTSQFESQTRIKGAGIALLTEIAGFKTDLMFSGGAADAASRRFGFVTKLSDIINVFAYTDSDKTNATKEGVGAEIFYKDLGPTISGQFFLAGNYAFGNVSITQKLGNIQPYASYYAPLNDLTDAINADRGKKQLLVGVNLTYYKDAFLNLEYCNKEGVNDIYTAGVQVNF
jgi:hypothetical protein